MYLCASPRTAPREKFLGEPDSTQEPLVFRAGLARDILELACEVCGSYFKPRSPNGPSNPRDESLGPNRSLLRVPAAGICACAW